MDYAYLFSGMGVTILYLLWRVIILTNSRNYYRHVITGVAMGKYKIKVKEEGDFVQTEIVEVKK